MKKQPKSKRLEPRSPESLNCMRGSRLSKNIHSRCFVISLLIRRSGCLASMISCIANVRGNAKDKSGKKKCTHIKRSWTKRNLNWGRWDRLSLLMRRSWSRWCPGLEICLISKYIWRHTRIGKRLTELLRCSKHVRMSLGPVKSQTRYWRKSTPSFRCKLSSLEATCVAHLTKRSTLHTHRI